jgi:phosphate starvation-inducible membrane PsiE
MARKFSFGFGLENQPKLLLIIYLVLAMVLVSLKPTYSLTKKVFGTKSDEQEYGVGEKFTRMGFLVHIVVFALLASIPFYFIAEYK